MANKRTRRPRVRKAYDLLELQYSLTAAVKRAEDVLLRHGVDDELALKAVGALTTAAGALARILETSDLRQEVEALRAEVAELRGSATLRKVA